VKNLPNQYQLREEIENAIKKIEVDVLPGHEKREIVVAGVVDWLDARLAFKGPFGAVAELATDAVLRLVIGGLVQALFDRLRANGKI
jgi:hypothetical protein